MKNKKAILLLVTILLVTIAVMTSSVFAQEGSTDGQAGVDESAASLFELERQPFDLTEWTELGEGDGSYYPEQINVPDSANGIDYVIPPAGPQGFYIENGIFRTPLPPEEHYAVGSFRFWAWEELNPSNGNYDWDRLDNWVQDQLDAGYESVGIALMTYTGRLVRCPLQGVDMMPAYVRKGQDNILGTADDPIIVAADPDKRDDALENFSGCNNFGGPWYLPDYTHPYYKAKYQVFIQALAEHLLNSPYRDQVGWIATGTGKDGENRAADNRPHYVYAMDESFLRDNGHLSVSQWVEYVRWVMDTYADAFYTGSGNPRIQVINQNAPHYLGTAGRRIIADYAKRNNIGLSINGMTADFTGTEACDSTDPAVWCTGMYDQARQYNDDIPISFESYSYMMGTPNEFYWAMARALDFPGDYMRLSSFWESRPYNPNDYTVAEWAAKYFGTGFRSGEEEPPSLWSRMREHRFPTYLTYDVISSWTANVWPTNGNYEFYLTQVHSEVYEGVTIPVTDDERNLTTNGITGWDRPESNVTDKPEHYNQDPFDQQLFNAGLYQPSSGERAQNQVDPGMVARRSDQANNQSKFIFDAEDTYFERSSPPYESTFKAIVTITYLDTGTDKWSLIYDAVGGPTPAMLHAVNDWTVPGGLAVGGGVPSNGKVEPPVDFVQKTGTGAWKIATFVIEDGNFNNFLLGGKADFYIESRAPNGGWDGDEYIHHVDIQKVEEIIEVDPTPTFTPTPTPEPTETPTPVSNPIYLPLIRVNQ